MSADPIDFEKYAQTLQQVMGDAVAEAEALAALAASDREAAADLHVGRQAKLNELKHQAREIADAHMAKRRRQLKADFQIALLDSITTKLRQRDQSEAEIAKLLGLADDSDTPVSTILTR